MRNLAGVRRSPGSSNQGQDVQSHPGCGCIHSIPGGQSAARLRSALRLMRNHYPDRRTGRECPRFRVFDRVERQSYVLACCSQRFAAQATVSGRLTTHGSMAAFDRQVARLREKQPRGPAVAAPVFQDLRHTLRALYFSCCASSKV